jgi:hypothetical protein
VSIHNLHAMKPSLPGDVRIDRSTPLGNPFRITASQNRDIVLRKFEVYARDRILRDYAWRQRVKDLRGKRLFCYCFPLLCHGNILEKLCKEIHDGEL